MIRNRLHIYRVNLGALLYRQWRKINGAATGIRIHHPALYRLLFSIPFAVANNFAKPIINQMLGNRGIYADKTVVGTVGAAPQYDSYYQDNVDFSQYTTDVKAVAFYLPQFHRIPENDQWWGDGFTEWENTIKARPRFKGHYQPRRAHPDFGHYDLSDVTILKKQAELARQHGIYGFCFYYYWFAGKRLLERPLDLLIEHPEIDLNFCLCWANENWTRTWDGLESSVLIAQDYSAANDIVFISDLTRYLEDPRYIRINGKPVIVVYRPLDIPDPVATFERWRKWCRENGIGEIQVLAIRSFFNADSDMKLGAAVDREVEFPPHRVASIPRIDPRHLKIYEGNPFIFDYRFLVEDVLAGNAVADKLPRPIYRTVMLGWDNSARREEGWSVWHGFSLDAYYRWLRYIKDYTQRNFTQEQRYVFINGWNEWAEGTYLEPDRKYGYASINTTSRALFDLPCHQHFEVLQPVEGKESKKINPGTIAVHAHIFHPEQADELLSYVNNIPYRFDLFITTDTEEKKRHIAAAGQARCGGRTAIIRLTPNVGRDIAPFVVGCKDLVDRYDYLCHVHSKKADTVDWGHLWRRYLLENLLGSEECVKSIFKCFNDNPDIGIIFPPAFPLIRPFCDWGGNEERCASLMQRLGYSDEILDFSPVFPAGNMFWIKSKAVARLFKHDLDYGDFEEEAGQIKLTLGHAIERIWAYVAKADGYRSLVALPRRNGVITDTRKKKRAAFFAHYSDANEIQDCDAFYLESLARIAESVVCISNNELTESELRKIDAYTDRVIIRENKGFDFGAWRDGLHEFGFERLNEYDEVILANNSCYAPVFPFEEMFERMDADGSDFWGITAFPENENLAREEMAFLKDGIMPRHLQSYFMVFRRPVIESPAFRSFWENVDDEDDPLKVVARYEVQLTSYLERHGFTWGCYVWESLYLQKRDNFKPDFNALYCLPVDFIVLRCPFVKKKIRRYVSDEEMPAVIDSIRRLTDYPVRFLET